MLPTGDDTRMVLYQYGMDADPDEQLELGMTAGCSGRAWETLKPAVANLDAAKRSYAREWRMTQEQQVRFALEELGRTWADIVSRVLAHS